MKKFLQTLCLILVVSFLFSACEIPNQENQSSSFSQWVSEEKSESVSRIPFEESSQETSQETSQESSQEASQDNSNQQSVNPELNYNEIASKGYLDLAQIPDYSGSPYCVVDDNVPNFSKAELRALPFEFYGNLDNLGRCTYVLACVGKDTMPTEPRGEIGSVKPTGWKISKYDSVDGKYLYNRCHLIGFQLTGENANNKNLITGTRYMNVQGMLPFENQIADYVKSTGNHVLYRVTPVFQGENLLAHGVRMEAFSVEDGGKGVCFDVFCYNVQPRIAIDYATGENEYAGIDDYEVEGETTFIINKNSKKFHKPSCPSVDDIKEENRQTTTKSASALISEGYSPCGNCSP